MNRVKFYRHDEQGAVKQAVVLITQSLEALMRSGMRFRTLREAEREMMRTGWTRKKLVPLSAAELA